jgi:hypothetical protein
LNGAGRLTITQIDAIQSFYGLCILQNKGDSKAMAKATKAILYRHIVFDRLGDANFLAGCEKCVTQNPNLSLHHVIWGLAPKEQYTSPCETSLAVSLGCLLFNSGMEVTYSQLLPKIGLNVDDNMVKEWKKVDKKRLGTAEYKDKAAVKNRRKKYKRQRATKADAFVQKEGIQYKSQEFYGGTATAKENGKKKRKNV